MKWYHTSAITLSVCLFEWSRQKSGLILNGEHELYAVTLPLLIQIGIAGSIFAVTHSALKKEFTKTLFAFSLFAGLQFVAFQQAKMSQQQRASKASGETNSSELIKVQIAKSELETDNRRALVESEKLRFKKAVDSLKSHAQAQNKSLKAAHDRRKQTAKRSTYAASISEAIKNIEEEYRHDTNKVGKQLRKAIEIAEAEYYQLTRPSQNKELSPVEIAILQRERTAQASKELFQDFDDLQNSILFPLLLFLCCFFQIKYAQQSASAAWIKAFFIENGVAILRKTGFLIPVIEPLPTVQDEILLPTKTLQKVKLNLKDPSVKAKILSITEMSSLEAIKGRVSRRDNSALTRMSFEEIVGKLKRHGIELEVNGDGMPCFYRFE